MKNLSLIAAIGKNNELGQNNNLIWKIKEDMKFFKTTTTGHYIVMGRKTFESLKGILPNRKHIILTNSNMDFPEEIIKYNNIKAFLDFAQTIDDEMFVIGGASIYKELIDYCHTMYLTEIDETFNNADAYFPTINYSEWNQEIINEFPDNKPKYLRKIYTRK